MCFHRRKIKKKSSLSVLSKKEDFNKLKNQGVRIKRGCFFLLYRPNSLLFCRFAWAFCLRGPQKAVRRNKLKRWARAFMVQKQIQKQTQKHPQKQHLWRGLDILLGVRQGKSVSDLKNKASKANHKLTGKNLAHHPLKYKDNQPFKKYENFCLEVEKLCSRIKL